MADALLHTYHDDAAAVENFMEKLRELFDPSNPQSPYGKLNQVFDSKILDRFPAFRVYRSALGEMEKSLLHSVDALGAAEGRGFILGIFKDVFYHTVELHKVRDALIAASALWRGRTVPDFQDQGAMAEEAHCLVKKMEALYPYYDYARLLPSDINGGHLRLERMCRFLTGMSYGDAYTKFEKEWMSMDRRPLLNQFLCPATHLRNLLNHARERTRNATEDSQFQDLDCAIALLTFDNLKSNGHFTMEIQRTAADVQPCFYSMMFALLDPDARTQYIAEAKQAFDFSFTLLVDLRVLKDEIPYQAYDHFNAPFSAKFRHWQIYGFSMDARTSHRVKIGFYEEPKYDTEYLHVTEQHNVGRHHLSSRQTRLLLTAELSLRQQRRTGTREPGGVER